MIADIWRVMIGRAGAHDLLASNDQSKNVAYSQRLRVEDLFAARNRSLLRISRIPPGGEQVECVGVECVPFRVTSERVINSGVILLPRKKLRTAVCITRQVTGPEIGELCRI